MKPKIFLSYSSKDKKRLKNIVAYVEKLNVELIHDKNFMRPTHQISEEVRQQVQNSDACLWILTENSSKSQWSLMEVGAFWAAKKPVCIYNLDKVALEKTPLILIKQAEDFPDIEKAFEDLKPQSRILTNLTVQEATKLIKGSVESSVKGLSERLKHLDEYIPAMDDVRNHLKVRNTFLPNHAALLSRITEMVNRKPESLICAFDVPSFGSVSATDEYKDCCDAFDRYVLEKEWDLTILLLPCAVGEKIVESEFSDPIKRKQAWDEDIKALNRFQRYAEHAIDQPNRKFEIRWLQSNKDGTGKTLGVHSMPLNVWVSSEEEAVFSTVINNYHPPNANASELKSSEADESNFESPKETGFSTQNRHMFRFLNEIIKKYKLNIDKSITLEAQIASSEEERSRIEALISDQDDNLHQDKKNKVN